MSIDAETDFPPNKEDPPLDPPLGAGAAEIEAGMEAGPPVTTLPDRLRVGEVGATAATEVVVVVAAFLTPWVDKASSILSAA